ncbi:hypothetical protein [Trichothermofontia sp.]
MTHSPSSSPFAPRSEFNQATPPSMLHSSPTHDTPVVSQSDRSPVTDEDTFSRTILALTETNLAQGLPELLVGEPSATTTAILTSVLGAIDPLLKMVDHLRSPVGDWPPDLPWTPANVYPYVADEAYDALNAYQTALDTLPPSPLGGGPLPSPRYWLLQDLAPRLLWAIAHGGAALMSLLSGVTATVQTPQGEWQGGWLRLVVVLTATPTVAAVAPWAVDLAVQRPPLPGIAPDRPLQILPTLLNWEDGTAAQLLTQVHTWIDQDQPSLAAWFGGIAGDWLMPGSPWQSGTFTLHCDLDFIPLPRLVMAATRGNMALVSPPPVSPAADSARDVPQTAAPPVAGISVPLSLYEPDCEEAGGDTDGETTIFFLDDEGEEGEEEGTLEMAEPLGETTDSVGSAIAIAATEATDIANDLIPPFPATPLTDTPNPPDPLPPITASSLFDEAGEEKPENTPPWPPSAPTERRPIAASTDRGSWAVDPDQADELNALELEDDTLLTVAAMFPDLPTLGTVIADAGPIARLRWQPSPIPARSPLWREALLRRQLLAYLPTWQRLAQPSDSSHQTVVDPDPLMLALMDMACTLSPQLEQPERWLLPPVLSAFYTESGCSLSDLWLGLFWSVTRSTYAIAQLVGGVYAQVLQPEQRWQTGTLRLVLILTITTDEQTWRWDLGTRQWLTTVPQGLASDAIIGLEHLPAYPTPLRVTELQEQLMVQLRTSEPLFMAWEGGIPLAWQATEAMDWQPGQWSLTSHLEFVATS